MGENQIKIGSVVDLKSHPEFPMTVVNIHNNTHAECCWIHQGDIKSAKIPIEGLRVVRY